MQAFGINQNLKVIKSTSVLNSMKSISFHRKFKNNSPNTCKILRYEFPRKEVKLDKYAS